MFSTSEFGDNFREVIVCDRDNASRTYFDAISCAEDKEFP